MGNETDALRTTIGFAATLTTSKRTTVSGAVGNMARVGAVEEAAVDHENRSESPRGWAFLKSGRSEIRSVRTQNFFMKQCGTFPKVIASHAFATTRVRS